MKLAEQLGSFGGQIIESGLLSVNIEYQGHVATLNTRPLTSLLLMGLLRPSLESVNSVNAPLLAKERGVKLSETKRDDEGDYHTLVRLTIETEKQKYQLTGTLFSGKPRLVGIDDVTLETELTPRMLFIRNEDKPGFIGRLGSTLGDAKINIANFNLGRSKPGANAVCLVAIDDDLSTDLLAKIKKLPGVVGVHVLRFDN
jgi:D-3-phosphoglycerate dehydrogenase